MCPKCGDIFNLCFHEKKCSCGHVSGKYISHFSVNVKNGKLIGFDNESFSLSLKNGGDFKSFVIA